VLVSALVS
jgi:hypothetical protein